MSRPENVLAYGRDGTIQVMRPLGGGWYQLSGPRPDGRVWVMGPGPAYAEMTRTPDELAELRSAIAASALDRAADAAVFTLGEYNTLRAEGCDIEAEQRRRRRALVEQELGMTVEEAVASLTDADLYEVGVGCLNLGVDGSCPLGGGR